MTLEQIKTQIEAKGWEYNCIGEYKVIIIRRMDDFDETFTAITEFIAAKAALARLERGE